MIPNLSPKPMALSFLVLAATAMHAEQEFLGGYVLHGNPDAWRLNVPQTLRIISKEANAVFSVETYRKGPASTSDWQGRGKRADIDRLLSLAQEQRIGVFALFYYGYGQIEACPRDPERATGVNHVLRNMVEDCGSYPSFRGIYFDSVASTHRGCDFCLPEFARFVKDRYDAGTLTQAGIGDTTRLAPPQRTATTAERFLDAAWDRFLRLANMDFVRGVTDAVHALRPGLVVLAGAGSARSPRDAYHLPLPQAVDGVLVDVGINGLIEDAILGELARSNQSPTYGLYSMYYDYTYSEARRAKALAIAIAHADGLIVGDWEHAGPQPERREEHPPDGAENYYWKNSQATSETFRTAFAETASGRSCLATTRSPAEIAVVVSEASWRFSKGGPLSPYFCHLSGVYAALTQAHVQTDLIWAEKLGADTLRPYRVLVLPAAPFLSPEEAVAIRRWVEDGGQLIALGQSGTQTEWGTTRSDGAFASLCGVSFSEPRKSGAELRIVPVDALPFFRAPPKPVDCRVGHYRDEPVPFENEVASVTPCGGTAVFGQFADGTPGATVARIGQGRVFFLAPQSLGLAHDGDHYFEEYAKIFLFRRFCPWPLVRQFRPGVRELIADLTLSSLLASGGRPPFTVHSCPEQVELALRVQPERDRRILHVTNFGDSPETGRIEVTLSLPRETASPGVRLLTGDGILRHRRVKQGVRISLTGLQNHAAILVEPHEPK